MASERNHLKYGRPNGRFDSVTLAKRLERLRAKADVEPKAVAVKVFPNQEQENAARSWYKRANQFREPFKLGELEIAIEYLLEEGHRKGTIPADIRELPGFPFIEYGDAVKLERGT